MSEGENSATWPAEWPLRTEIETANGDILRVLKLREPLASDLIRFGLPYDANGDVSYDRLLDMVAEFSGLARPIVARMSAADLIGLGGRIGRFFAVAAL